MSLARSLPRTSSVRPAVASAINDGTNIAGFARDLAARHGVAFADSALDRFAAAASRLSDAEVQPDATEDLLVALARAGVISTREGLVLHDAYLRQKDE